MVIDRCLKCLSDAHRRQTLYLLEAEGEGGREELAERLMEFVDSKSLRQVRTELHHVHLPKLADVGLIEYDGRSGNVMLTDEVSEVQPLLEAIRNLEAASINSPSAPSTDCD